MFAEITSNTVDTHNVAVKDATVTNDTTNERLSILNVDDNLKNNQSNMEFVDNDSNTDNINEGDLQMVEVANNNNNCCEMDLKSTYTAGHNWQVATETIKSQKQKIQTLQRQVQRLKRKVADMKCIELEKMRIKCEAQTILPLRNTPHFTLPFLFLIFPQWT